MWLVLNINPLKYCNIQNGFSKPKKLSSGDPALVTEPDGTH
jgi:hypothetical protein